MRVFLSYAGHDYRIAHGLASRLGTEGRDVPLDLDARLEVHDLDLAGRSQQTIRRRLDEADAFVVLISTAAYASPSIRAEWIEIVRRIWENDDMIALPVLLDDSELPGFLSNHTALRWEGDPDRLADRVLEYLLDPRERGVQRTHEGQVRLDRRISEIQHMAAAVAERDEVG